MLEFASNTTVRITVPHQYNGTDLTLTGVEYEVLDANSNVLVNRAAASGFNASNDATEITIPTLANTTLAKRDVRLLNCYLIAGADEYIVPQVYMLKGNQLALTPLVDSFMTYPDSVLTRARMSEEQEYFDQLSPELQAVALEESFTRIAKLKFRIGTVIIESIKDIDLSAFQALDPEFQLSLKKAQIAEANSLVEQSPIRDKIRAGIISETIGESSMFFARSMPSGKFHGLNDDAYEYIKPYIYRDIGSSSIWKVNRA